MFGFSNKKKEVKEGQETSSDSLMQGQNKSTPSFNSDFNGGFNNENKSLDLKNVPPPPVNNEFNGVKGAGAAAEQVTQNQSAENTSIDQNKTQDQAQDQSSSDDVSFEIPDFTEEDIDLNINTSDFDRSDDESSKSDKLNDELSNDLNNQASNASVDDETNDKNDDLGGTSSVSDQFNQSPSFDDGDNSEKLEDDSIQQTEGLDNDSSDWESDVSDAAQDEDVDEVDAPDEPSEPGEPDALPKTEDVEDDVVGDGSVNFEESDGDDLPQFEADSDKDDLEESGKFDDIDAYEVEGEDLPQFEVSSNVKPKFISKPDYKTIILSIKNMDEIAKDLLKKESEFLGIESELKKDSMDMEKDVLMFKESFITIDKTFFKM